MCFIPIYELQFYWYFLWLFESYKLFFLVGRDLSYNQLTGEIPFNIGFLQVATLYVLVIYFNWSLMSDFHLMNLTFKYYGYRSLQGNRLTGTIPSVIGLMQALAVL